MLISKWFRNIAKFSKIIPDPMFEKWFLNNANFFGGPKFFILETYLIRVEFLLNPVHLHSPLPFQASSQQQSKTDS